MAATPNDPPQLPARLAERYVLEDRLADGGSAEVWLAHDPVLDRAVAVKVLHRHLLSDSTMRARLEQEARAAAALSHPGIVTIHDVEADDTAAAVVLEFVAGEPLSELLRREGPLPPTEAARIAAEVAEALAHAHERGVIHRDVKPGNVLIEPDGRARLVDFGIARIMEDAESRLTTTGTIAGTLRYLAPEQLRGETAGPPADVYGVGVVLAEMLTGRPPYEADNPIALAEAQRLPAPSIVGAPPELATLVGRCLDPDPERRPASAGELASELRAWLAGPVDPEARTATYAVVGAAAAAAVERDTGEPSPTSTTIQAVPAVPAAAEMPAAAPAVVPATASDSSHPSRWAFWPVLAAILGIALVVVVIASFPRSSPSQAGLGASPGSSSTAGEPGEPSAAAAASDKPAAGPATVAGAVAAFKERVDSAEGRGAIERRDADDLRKRADDIAKKADNPKRDDTAKKIDDLRKKVDDLERTKKVGSDVADALRTAIDDIETAAEE